MEPSERALIQGLRLELEDLAESFREVAKAVGAQTSDEDVDKVMTTAHGHLLSAIRELEAV